MNLEDIVLSKTGQVHQFKKFLIVFMRYLSSQIHSISRGMMVAKG